ncbi:MAG: hypothetical protein ACYC3A_05795 [Halothiobacillus sp.]
MNVNTIIALVLLGFAGIVYLSKYQYDSGYHAAELAAMQSERQGIARAIDQANALNAQDSAILRTAEATRTQARIIYKTITKTAVRHVSQNPDLYSQRLDACGLCLKTAAASGISASTCACEPDGSPTTHALK